MKWEEQNEESQGVILNGNVEKGWGATKKGFIKGWMPGLSEKKKTWNISLGNTEQ